MAQLLINLCDIWTSQLCQRDNVRHTYTQALSIPSVNHGILAEQPVPLLREAGPAMASLELGNIEAKVPSFHPQITSCLVDICPWTRREGAVHTHLCSWENIYTSIISSPYVMDSSGTTAE